MESRWVLHLDMDAFFASVEQLTRPTLRGRPVLVGGLGGRGVVAGASYEARVFGARSAMPMHQARRMIGVTAVVLPPRGVVYGIASRRVFDAVRGVVPVVEQLSFDEAFGEPSQLAGASAHDVEEFCEGLRRRVRDETGLVASVGAGSGKQIAKIASGLAKPDGIRVVRRAEERLLLDGLAVRRLWGIGPVAEEKLNRLGIETIGQLAALTDAEVANILGATVGPALHRLARGIDDRPVAERAEAKQISAESTFAVDLTSLEQLHNAIDPIAEHAHQRLVRDGRGARTVTVKLKKSDMSTLTRSATLPYATAEAASLIAVARRLLLDPREIGPIRLLGVGFSGLSDVRQESLFPDLELAAPETEAAHSFEAATETATEAVFAPAAEASPWRVGDDVEHRELGHGWVQGAGHGVVTVRFETRSSGPGQAKTFPAGTAGLVGANPVDSLDWPDYLGALRAEEPADASAPAGDDIADR
ncbi:DNA polymerase IV [Mycobacterium montefiorense]|uniref:DNA polymerase IV n=3 Tax=Mycobacterium montefiorense TaxID=154654 RepID=A0AA37PJK9_9MYCO|nr:DNA polymerase IV 1 [Mycobacterium montefiorense]GKU34341.1 DNA polymerase IV 1 [Mycobacterium montefiorense]GKU38962.1 DNA polymerase IV 1 [Mycobacterium montefiorense]GKU49727.1 DNA polymerase IV 1 [Mycobacterium montefiorense]GKU57524.1 DNA polymerase IV 1 [Mycobacterium montefiorense]